MHVTGHFRHPAALIGTDALAARLGEPSLRIYDCTTWLLADHDDEPYRVQSGRADYRQAHIPGSAFLDLQADLSDADSPYRFTMPAPDVLAARFAEHGIGDEGLVVLYSRGNPQWATRIWWMLRSLGVDHAAVLDGGWDKWLREGRPARGGDERYRPATLSARPRPGLFVDRAAVLAALADPAARVVNALSPESHAGRSPRYGRPGRIAGSVNVPALSLRDPESLALVAPDAAAAAFAAAGVESGQRVVVYCGGGIAATLDAFVLHQLGYEDVAVYDNSLNEWANDPALPMETD